MLYCSTLLYTACKSYDFYQALVKPFWQALVNTMLRADPNDRPSTRDLLQLPYVRKHMAILLGVGSVAQGVSGSG